MTLLLYMDIITFNKNTINNDYFKFEDVPYDNICFYRSILNSMNKKKISNEDCEELQKKIYNWILENIDTYIVEYQMDVKNLIIVTHDCDINEYLERYNVFAGVNNEEIEDRWGGLIEQIVVSNIFKINIIIYTTQKFDNKKKKVITGKVIKNKPEKDVRLKNIQNINYSDKSDTIYLLWKNYNKQGHYMSLFIT